MVPGGGQKREAVPVPTRLPGRVSILPHSIRSLGAATLKRAHGHRNWGDFGLLPNSAGIQGIDLQESHLQWFRESTSR